MTVGDPVLRTGKPLSVELGPGRLISDKADSRLDDQHLRVRKVEILSLR